jgi:hypothetical protein
MNEATQQQCSHQEDLVGPLEGIFFEADITAMLSSDRYQVTWQDYENTIWGQAWWLTRAIPATQEVEIQGSRFESSTVKNNKQARHGGTYM